MPLILSPSIFLSISDSYRITHTLTRFKCDSFTQHGLQLFFSLTKLISFLKYLILVWCYFIISIFTQLCLFYCPHLFHSFCLCVGFCAYCFTAPFLFYHLLYCLYAFPLFGRNFFCYINEYPKKSIMLIRAVSSRHYSHATINSFSCFPCIRKAGFPPNLAAQWGPRTRPRQWNVSGSDLCPSRWRHWEVCVLCPPPLHLLWHMWDYM